MDAARIIHDLTHYDGLPVDAIRAADADRQALVPVFLEEIERYLAASPEDRAEPNPLFFIFHLLGSWRETSAYRPLTQLLRCPTHDIEHVLGDATTETSNRVMAAIFDGDAQPLHHLILDPNADEFIRSSMLETLAMVTHAGSLPRANAQRFLMDCYSDLKPVHECFVWNGWQKAIALLGLAELESLVRRAFARGSIETVWLGVDHFERDLKEALEDPDAPFARGEFSFFGDTIEELSTWAAFRPERRNAREDRVPVAARNRASPGQAINPRRKVGRNDPCPCGSGKKFKKCCLARLQDGSASPEGIHAAASWR